LHAEDTFGTSVGT